MDPVGEQLRQAREAKGLSLGDIAKVTKISVAALTALERGDVLRLPGGIFGRSFVRAFALQVDLDPDVITAGFASEVADAERDSARKRIRASVTPDDKEFAARQRRAITILRRSLIGLAVIAAALIAWQVWVWRIGAAETQESPPPAPEFAAGRSVGGPPPADPTGATPPPAEADVSLSSDPPAALPGERTADPAGAAAPGESRPIPVVEELRVGVEASADCWLKVLADGLVIHERLLTAGSRQSFVAQQTMVLDVGDACAIRWTINGRPARPIGGAGVHRVVTVTRQNVASFLVE
jgi:cytoskeleton protein RodZ